MSVAVITNRRRRRRERGRPVYGYEVWRLWCRRVVLFAEVQPGVKVCCTSFTWETWGLDRERKMKMSSNSAISSCCSVDMRIMKKMTKEYLDE